MHKPLPRPIAPTDSSVAGCSDSGFELVQSNALTDVLTTAGDNCLNEALHYSSATTHVLSVQSSFAKANGSDSIRPDVDRVLKTKARRLCQMRPFVSSDQDDLLQELRIAWLANADRYDSDRGSLWPFLKTVVERTAGKLRDKALALRRYAMNTVSLDQISPPPGANAEPTLAGGDHKLLCAELHEAIQGLPTTLAQLCQLLDDQSVAEISRSMAIPRSTVVARVAAIRRRFESKKLSKFL